MPPDQQPNNQSQPPNPYDPNGQLPPMPQQPVAIPGQVIGGPSNAPQQFVPPAAPQSFPPPPPTTTTPPVAQPLPPNPNPNFLAPQFPPPTQLFVNQVPPAYPPVNAPYALASSGFPKKKLLIIGLIVGVVLVLGVGLALIFGKSDQSGSGSLVDKITGNAHPDVVDRPDGTLDLTNKINSNQTIANQSVQAKKGQQVNLVDGTSFLVKNMTRGVETKLKPTDFDYPKEGNELVQLELVVGSNDEKDSKLFSQVSFFVEASGGIVAKAEYGTDELYGLSRANVNSGEQATIYHVYEVPKGSTINFIYERSYEQIIGGNAIADIKATVSLE